jgi:hypothetical protein
LSVDGVCDTAAVADGDDAAGGREGEREGEDEFQHGVGVCMGLLEEGEGMLPSLKLRVKHL